MKLIITGQSIEWLDQTLIASGSDGIYEVEFEFEDAEDLPSWDDLTKYAVFKNTSLPEYGSVLMPIADGKAVIPAMIIADPGRLSVGVYGQNGYYTMPTIWAPQVQVDAGCAEGSEAAEQVMTSAQNAVKYGENAKVYAEGGYVVTKVEGTVDDPDITRQSSYTKGAKQYALEAAESASGAAGSAASAQQNAAAAETSEENAAASETAAGQSAAAAAGSATSAQQSAEAAETSEENAAASETAAGQSATAAAQSSSSAAESAASAQQSAASAETSEENAAASETAAGQSATAAAGSATSAAGSATAAQQSASAAAASEESAASSATSASQSASAAAASEASAAEYAAAAQTVVDSNFLLTDEDDGNKKYMVTLFARDGHLGIGFTAMPDEEE